MQRWPRAPLRRELSSRLGASSEGIANRIRQDRDGGQGDAAIRRTLDPDVSADELQIRTFWRAWASQLDGAGFPPQVADVEAPQVAAQAVRP